MASVFVKAKIANPMWDLFLSENELVVLSGKVLIPFLCRDILNLSQWREGV